MEKVQGFNHYGQIFKKGGLSRPNYHDNNHYVNIVFTTDAYYDYICVVSSNFS